MHRVCLISYMYQKFIMKCFMKNIYMKMNLLKNLDKKKYSLIENTQKQIQARKRI